jgi:hypothetical protein
MNIFLSDLLEPLSLPDGNNSLSQICLVAFKEFVSICEACSVEIVSKKPQVSARSRFAFILHLITPHLINCLLLQRVHSKIRHHLLSSPLSRFPSLSLSISILTYHTIPRRGHSPLLHYLSSMYRTIQTLSIHSQNLLHSFQRPPLV